MTGAVHLLHLPPAAARHRDRVRGPDPHLHGRPYAPIERPATTHCPAHRGPAAGVYTPALPVSASSQLRSKRPLTSPHLAALPVRELRRQWAVSGHRAAPVDWPTGRIQALEEDENTTRSNVHSFPPCGSRRFGAVNSTTTAIMLSTRRPIQNGMLFIPTAP